MTELKQSETAGSDWINFLSVLCSQSDMLWPALISCVSQLKLFGCPVANPHLHQYTTPVVPVYYSQLISDWLVEGLRNPKLMISISFWKTCVCYDVRLCCINHVVLSLLIETNSAKGKPRIALRSFDKYTEQFRSNAKREERSHAVMLCFHLLSCKNSKNNNITPVFISFLKKHSRYN